MSFQALGIDEDIVAALSERGITAPFPIQTEAIPLALSGNDVIGQAKTGTGKTLGFGLPLLQAIGGESGKETLALVVVPTRELAIQVASDLEIASSKRYTKVVAIYGGKAYEGQIQDLEAGAQVVVGTPGRLIDLANQRKLNLKHIKFLVLDEADEMLDLGFLPDVERIFSLLPETRQTMLF
jgi:superfamily II DNA/RNA helicase